MTEPTEQEIQEALECLVSYAEQNGDVEIAPWAPNDASQCILVAYRKEVELRQNAETVRDLAIEKAANYEMDNHALTKACKELQSKKDGKGGGPQ